MLCTQIAFCFCFGIENMLCTQIVFCFLLWHSEQFMYTTCSEFAVFMYWTPNSMNNLLSNWRWVDGRIIVSEKDTPVRFAFVSCLMHLFSLSSIGTFLCYLQLISAEISLKLSWSYYQIVSIEYYAKQSSNIFSNFKIWI